MVRILKLNVIKSSAKPIISGGRKVCNKGNAANINLFFWKKVYKCGIYKSKSCMVTSIFI